MKLIAFLLVFAICFACFVADGRFDYFERNKKPSNRIWCLNDQFTCSPSKCIPNSVLCDGISDCEDGSDENPDLCQSLKSCKLPHLSEDSTYIVNCTDEYLIRADEFVPEMTLLSFECKPGYARETGSHFQSFCLNSNWIPAPTPCTKICRKPDVPNLKYQCYFNNEEIECTDEYLPGTELKLLCTSPFHRVNHDEIVCKEDGEWDLENIKCEVECGRYSDEAERLLKGNDFPWHVLIKRKNPSNTTYLFSGTLVSPYLVMTVARSEVDLNDVKLAAKNFEVVVNNYLDEEYREVYKVKEILLPPSGFHTKTSISDESDDIALLVLDRKVEVSATVLPACIDWVPTQLQVEKKVPPGKIARFGDARNTMVPVKEEMYIITAEVHSLEKCLSDKVIQYDQYCAQITDYKTTDHSDFGTGYFLENINDRLYYIRGVYRVTYGSTGQKVFTNVSIHLDWLKSSFDYIEELNEFENRPKDLHPRSEMRDKKSDYPIEYKLKPISYGSLTLSCHEKQLHIKFTNGCTLPYTNETNFQYLAQCPSYESKNDVESFCKRTIDGAEVPAYTTLTTHCKCGYASSTNNEKSVCVEGKWFPPPQPCKKVCQKLKLEGISPKCTYEGKNISCDQDLFTGVHVHLDCLVGHAPEGTVKNQDLICNEEGEWSGQIFKCNSVCGKSKYGYQNFIEARIGEVGDFPWNIAIYDKYKKELICAGTILTPNIILTAAECFFDDDQKKKNLTDFVIAVAKKSKTYKEEDSPQTMHYDIESIFLRNYFGKYWKYFNDIALIQTKTKITFGSEVGPSCMQFDKNLASGRLLKTSGWKDDIWKLSDLPYYSFVECIEKAPASLKEYVFEDKFCAGSFNESVPNSAISGSGIFYFDKDSSSYHIVGVASSKLPDFPYISIFTNANYHGAWIRNILFGLHKQKQSH